MSEKYKILILEDNEFDTVLTVNELTHSDIIFTYKEVSNKIDYIAAISDFKPNVILSDHSLPTIYSEEALAIAKANCPDCIFILLTGTASEEFAVNILKKGADDYLLKSSLKRLPTAIANAYVKKHAEREKELNFIKLENANRELKTFIYRASHDLRGPVSSLRGLINVARNTEEDQRAAMMDMMEKSANKLDAILLELIESVKVRDHKPEKIQIDLVELINEIIEQFQFLTGFERITFNITNSSKHPFYSNKSLVRSILQNVVKNGIWYQNYMAARSFINIDISSDGKTHKIVITDNGIGIKKEYLENVFEMFYRANLLSEGSGLGLYLVKIAIDKIGGTIEIESVEKIGTTITISIPS